MIVNNNIMGMNAGNRFSGSSPEKLSSGYRINRSGDDAASLALSAATQAQAALFERFSDNAKDGISLIQTAESALAEIHSDLNRITELAAQSANEASGDGVNRDNLQKEVSFLKSEIDSIAESTNFNGTNLLDGSLGAAAEVIFKFTDYNTRISEAASGIKDLDVSNAYIASGAELNYSLKKKTVPAVFCCQFTYEKISFGFCCASNGISFAEKTVTVKTGNHAAAEVDANGSLSLTLQSDMPLESGNTPFLKALGDLLRSPALDNTAWANAVTRIFSGINPKYTCGTIADVITEAKTSTAALERSEVNSYELTINAGSSDTWTCTMSEDSHAAGGRITLKNAKKGSINVTLDKNAAEADNVTIASVVRLGGKPITTLSFAEKVGKDVVGCIIEINGAPYEFVKAGETASKDGITAIPVSDNSDDKAIAKALSSTVAADSSAFDAVKQGVNKDGAANGKVELTSATKEPVEIVQTGKGLSLQIGDTADNKVSIKTGNMGVRALDLDKVDVSTESRAIGSIPYIKAAINAVSGIRSDLSAVCNRLELKLDAANQNRATESRIRDTELVSEMMSYIKNNELSQAEQAMLDKANQQSQQVLQLLQ